MSGPDDWGTHKPEREEIRRSTTPRIRQRVYAEDASGPAENEAERRSRKQAHDEAVAKQDRLVKELEELRGTVQRMQREPLRESVDDAFFDRLQTLKREHERNLRVIERLYREKREAERRAETVESSKPAASARKRPGTAPGRRAGASGKSNRPGSARVSFAGPGRGSARGGRAEGGTAAEEEEDDDDHFAGGGGPGDESAPPPAAFEGDEGADGVDAGEETWTQRVRREMRLGEGREGEGEPARGRAISPSSAGGGGGSGGGWAAARRRVRPKPFVSMEVGSRVGGESIMARKLQQYLEEVRAREESHLRVRFRARDVPASTTEPRFEMMLQQHRARSDEAKALREKQLKESERPFRGMAEREREMEEKKQRREEERRAREAREHAGSQFRAKPIPPQVQAATREAEEAQERARRERIEARKAALLSEAKLPPRMEMWEKSRQAASKAGKGGAGKGGAGKGGAAPPKPKPVPDFAKLHGRWASKLRQSRQSARRTQPKAFSFIREDSARRKEEKARLRAREERERRRQEEEERRRAAEEARAPKPAPLGVEPAPTRAMSLRERETTKMLEERRRREARERAEAERRRKQQEEASKRFAPVVNDMHRRYLEEFKSGREYVALEDVAVSADGRPSAMARERAREAERRAKETARRLQESLRQSKDKAPSLLERFRVDVAKQKARQTGVERVASAMYAHKAAKHLAGKVRSRRDDVFDDGDKAVLDMLSATAGSGAARAAARDEDDDDVGGGDVPDYLK